MKLITKEIASRMPFRYSTENDEDPIVHLKLFNPYGTGTWLLTEGWQIIEQNGEYVDKPLSYIPQHNEQVVDIQFFGWCHIHEWEMGNVSLVDLMEVKKFGRPSIEREKSQSSGKYRVSELKRQ